MRDVLLCLKRRRESEKDEKALEINWLRTCAWSELDKQSTFVCSALTCSFITSLGLFGKSKLRERRFKVRLNPGYSSTNAIHISISLEAYL